MHVSVRGACSGVCACQENETVIAKCLSSVGCEVCVYISSASLGCESQGVRDSTTYNTYPSGGLDILARGTWSSARVRHTQLS
jgi:hypothetical protein